MIEFLDAAEELLAASDWYEEQQEGLVYVEDPRLVIVAVAHMSRRPGYWRQRLI